MTFPHHCIQNVKDRLQIQVCNVSNECLTHFSQFISEKVKKNLRKSQAQFREKLRQLGLKQKYGFLIKNKRVHMILYDILSYAHQMAMREINKFSIQYCNGNKQMNDRLTEILPQMRTLTKNSENWASRT